jgi:hypothetical protein
MKRRSYALWWAIAVVLAINALLTLFLVLPRSTPSLDAASLPAPQAEVSPIAIPPARAAEVAQMLTDVNRLLASGDLEAAVACFESATAVRFLRRSASEGKTLRLELRSIRLATPIGVATELALVAEKGFLVQTWRLEEAWVQKAEVGWRILAVTPTQPGPQAKVTRVVGSLRIDQQERSIEGDLTLDIDAQRQAILRLEVSSAWSDPSPSADSDRGLRWLAVSQAGQPCKITQLGARLYVEVPNPQPSLQLRLQFVGSPREDEQAYFSDNDAYMSALVPRLKGSTPTFDLLVSYRLGEGSRFDEPQLISGANVQPLEGAGEAWHRARVRGDGDMTPALLLAPLVPYGELRHGGFVAKVVGERHRTKEFALIQERSILALDRLAPLGPPPPGSVTLAPFYRRTEGLLGELDGRLILLQSAAQDEHVYAHEFAHMWFGRQVRVYSRKAGRWWEGVAEYVCTWGLEGRAARDVRLRRLADYDGIAEDEDLALVSELPRSAGASDLLSYGKAMLLMQALEVRIGRDRVVRFLRALAERYRGKFADWQEVLEALAAVETPEVAAWFRAWTERPGAPSLELEGTAADGTFSGAVVQNLGPGQAPFLGTIELGMIDAAGAVLAVHRVELAGERTEVVAPLAPGTRTVALDPDVRFPRHRWVRVDAATRRAAKVEIALDGAAR